VRLSIYVGTPLGLVKALRASENLPLPTLSECRMWTSPNEVHRGPAFGTDGSILGAKGTGATEAHGALLLRTQAGAQRRL
jgi:hypothetical protein